MGGLLYKDFVAVKGKKLVLTVGLFTILYILLRVLYPGTSEMDGFMAVNEAGETINVIDAFFFLGEFSILWLGGFWISTLGSKILQFDEKNRIRGYFAAMPFSKKTYVASKYVFIGIVAYVMLSVYMIWHISCMAFMGGGSVVNFSLLVAGFAIPYVCLLLLVSAIEIPMFLLMGKGKAMMVKVSFLILVGFVVLGYLLFGNLEVLANWDVEAFVQWAEEHAFEITLYSIVSPIITMIIYYISFRVTACLYERKEGIDE